MFIRRFLQPKVIPSSGNATLSTQGQENVKDFLEYFQKEFINVAALLKI